MDPSPTSLEFRALAVLLDAADRAGADVARPTPGLRFGCAFLWTLADAEGRKMLREFWTLLHDPNQPLDPLAAGSEYIRTTHGRTYVSGLSRQLGMSQSPAAWQALRDMGRR